jgi:hypothetical protein
MVSSVSRWSAAILTATLPAAAATAQTANTAQASFCTSAESVVFACRAGGRMVSVCASKAAGPNSGYLQYRFGQPGSTEPLELVLPEYHLPPPKVATGESVPFSGGGGSWLRFAKAPVAYTVYSGVGKWGPNGEVRAKGGIVVERQGKAIATLKCTSEPIGELGPDWFESVGIKANGQDFDFPD